MPNNIKQEVYIHQNFNGNEISNATLKDSIIHNSDFNNRPNPNIGEKIGLLYYDSDINRIMVWDGSTWRIVKYLDDRDLKGKEDIKLQNIWRNSYDLTFLTPQNVSGSQFVDLKTNVGLSYSQGTTYFENSDIKDVILPKTFADGSTIDDFFDAIVKDSQGNVIPKIDSNGEVWKLIQFENPDYTVDYKISFTDVPKYINNQPLTIDYYEYTGDKLQVSAIGGDITRQIYNASSGNQSTPQVYELPLLPLISSSNEVLSISLNGVELLNDTYDVVSDGSGGYNLEINTGTSSSGLGYTIDTTPPEDWIQVNFLIL